MIDHDKAYRASHDLWQAKATARLESTRRLQTLLIQMGRDGRIAPEVMSQIFDKISDNTVHEQEQTQGAEARWAEAQRGRGGDA